MLALYIPFRQISNYKTKPIHISQNTRCLVLECGLLKIKKIRDRIYGSGSDLVNHCNKLNESIRRLCLHG